MVDWGRIRIPPALERARTGLSFNSLNGATHSASKHKYNRIHRWLSSCGNASCIIFRNRYSPYLECYIHLVHRNNPSSFSCLLCRPPSFACNITLRTLLFFSPVSHRLSPFKFNVLFALDGRRKRVKGSLLFARSSRSPFVNSKGARFCWRCCCCSTTHLHFFFFF